MNTSLLKQKAHICDVSTLLSQDDAQKQFDVFLEVLSEH